MAKLALTIFALAAVWLAGCIGAGGITQAKINAGYVHFHKKTAVNWDQGHGPNPDSPIMGYWLRHIQVDPTEDPMGIGPSAVGEVYTIMPNSDMAPNCPLVVA